MARARERKISERVQERELISDYVEKMAGGYVVSGSQTDRLIGAILSAIAGNIRDGVYLRQK